jgi:hypothetical protein
MATMAYCGQMLTVAGQQLAGRLAFSIWCGAIGGDCLGFVCALLLSSLTLREQPMTPSHDGGFVLSQKGRITVSCNIAFPF